MLSGERPIVAPEPTEAPDNRMPEGNVISLDLSTHWAPRVLAGGYRESYVALADERFDQAAEADRARRERYLELYGIPPNFRVLRDRIRDQSVTECHAKVDDNWFDRGTLPRPYADPESSRSAIVDYALVRRMLDRERELAGVPAVDDLRSRILTVPQAEAAKRARRKPTRDEQRDIAARLRLRWMFERHDRLAKTVEPILALQGHLACDGLLPERAERAVFDAWTREAVKAFQRVNAIVGVGNVDEETVQVLRMPPSERHFRAVLRSLRERVIDATGLLEDGSAQGKLGTVFGRPLDSRAVQLAARLPPMPNAAPDLISPAVEHVATQLGWTSPEATTASLAGMTDTELADRRLDVRIPNRPAYHSAHMELRAEIERGDVYYEYPFFMDGRPRNLPVRRRPTITLYAKDGNREVALVRWSTTIGGFKTEKLDSGATALVYKESDVGDRVWRQLVAAPAWFPPPSTPDEDLVRNVPGGGVELQRDLLGPGYASAYGLVMLPNEVRVEVRPPRTKVRGRLVANAPTLPPEVRYVDRGIRVHGSVSYPSIVKGTSHGCHRLFNHLAVRLGGFLLMHRNHEDQGENRTLYARRVVSKGHVFDLRMPSRGHTYALTPPVPVRVLEGTIRGRLKRAPRGAFALPEVLARRAESLLATPE